MPKEKPNLHIGDVIRSYRTSRGLSQGDIERRTGLLRCYLSRVENGHTVPSLETLAKIADALGMSLADFFPVPDTPEEREARRLAGELTEEELRILSDLKRYTAGMSENDRALVLLMIQRMAASRRSSDIGSRNS
jgi:transcriptional regulator with XRE-family HTH domain